jgi:hypothetical protein
VDLGANARGVEVGIGPGVMVKEGAVAGEIVVVRGMADRGAKLGAPLDEPAGSVRRGATAAINGAVFTITCPSRHHT